MSQLEFRTPQYGYQRLIRENECPTMMNTCCALRRASSKASSPQAPAPKPRHPACTPPRGAGVPRPRRAWGLTRRVGVAPQTRDAAANRRSLPTPGDMEMTADTRQPTDHTCTRRFSEGIEQLPDIPEKRLTGRFSSGIERSPNTPEKTVTRRFSEGIEQLPDTPEKRALGRFSRGIEHHFEQAR